MKIISSYVLKLFFHIFSLALIAFVGIYVIIDFFEKIDNMMEKHAASLQTCLYFVYRVPTVVAQGIPMAALLAALITLGILNRNREIIALRAAGLSASTYAGPILVVALCLSLADFGIAEGLSRTLNYKAQRIWEQQVLHRKSAVSWSQENVWYHGQNLIYEIRLYNKRTQTFEKVTLFYLDPQFRLIQRLDARRMYWRAHQWIAEDGLILKLDGHTTRQEWFTEMPLDLREKPKDFSGMETIPEELTWTKLYRYARKIQQDGYDAAPYIVELHLREAFPLTTFVLALLGVIIAMRQGHQGGIAFSVGIALLLAFFYLTVLQVGCSMATAGILPPLIGVWASNIILAASGVYLWITAPQ